MVCPACGTEMFVLEFELVEIDHCAECGGVWLDSGELALIGRRVGALHGDLLALLEKGRGEPEQTGPKRRCPVCRKRLLRAPPFGQARGKLPVPPQSPQAQPRAQGPNIQVEKCPRGDGLWFEVGSLRAVIQAAGTDSGNVFVRFLADLDARRSAAARMGTGEKHG
jgi:Zn-finger nucleic acid-binding protein